MKKTIILLGLLCLVFVSACSAPETVGGPCSYDSFDAIATITAVNGTQTTFTWEFTAVDNELTDHQQSLYDAYNDREFTQETDLEYSVGQEEFIYADIINQGTCTPFVFYFVGWGED